MKKYCILSIVACVSIVLLSFCYTGISSAALIDFTENTPWHDAHGLVTYTYMNTTLTASPGGSLLWQDSEDGLGIQSSPIADIPAGYENDEIEGDELLTISFLHDVFLNNLYIADLFYEPGEQGYYEMGQYSINGGSWVDFLSDGTGTNGELLLVLNIPNVSYIQFMAPGKSIPGQNHEFAVQGIDVDAGSSELPEPGTMLLLGSGLAGYYITRRKRRSR